MANFKIEEGYMPFMGYNTYYRIVGEKADGKGPLLLLHGGPGSTHNYFELLDSLAATGRQVISYDQLGCGKSYVEGHPELWTAETWINELKSLIDYLHLDNVHLLGQSWGGMLAIKYLIDEKAEHISTAILSSTLSDSQLWGREQHRLITFMSEADQEAIARAEATGNYNDADYLAANERFMLLHCAAAPTEESAECLRRKKRAGTEAYVTAWGPNEYTPEGNLSDFYYTDRLNEINVPCMIMSGTNDLCTPLVAKTMYDAIRDAEWHLFDGARHMCFAEQNEKYCRLLADFMSKHEQAL